jgi:hypothetical protein
MICAMNVRQWVAIELGAIGAAALAFVATVRVRPLFLDFALAGCAVALIALSARRSTALWSASSATEAPRPRPRDAWLASTAFTGLALGVLLVLGVLVGDHALLGGELPPFGERLENWHVLIAMLAYFPWALLQQYIFQHYLLARLLHVVPLPAAVAITAAAFSSVHFPRWPVMAVVLVAGAVWALIYYRWRYYGWRTLLPLACSHALLGPALHYWVFGHDLLASWLP